MKRKLENFEKLLPSERHKRYIRLEFSITSNGNFLITKRYCVAILRYEIPVRDDNCVRGARISSKALFHLYHSLVVLVV